VVGVVVLHAVATSAISAGVRSACRRRASTPRRQRRQHVNDTAVDQAARLPPGQGVDGIVRAAPTCRRSTVAASGTVFSTSARNARVEMVRRSFATSSATLASTSASSTSTM